MSEVSEKTPSSMKVAAPFEQSTNNASSELQGMHYSYRLDGRNYLQWSQLVRTFLKGRGKIAHLTRPVPQTSDPAFAAWDIEDSMLMSWLWNSMQPEVSKNYMFLPTAKDIWDTVKRTYSKVQDASVIFEIKTKITSTKQGSLSVTDYYNQMNGYWIELDHYQDVKMVCSEDATTLTTMLERDRIVEFLAGLNPEYDQIRIQILGKKKLPSLNEVFSMIRSEEHRRIAMLDESNIDRSAMIFAKPVDPHTRPQNLPSASMSKNSSSRQKQNREEAVLNRIGGFKNLQSRNQANLASHEPYEVPEKPTTMVPELGEFSEDEISKLRSFLKTIQSSSCSLAQTDSHVLNENGQSISVSGDQDQQEISDSITKQSSIPSVVRFKGSPYVFKRRSQPILDSQHVPNSSPNSGTAKVDSFPCSNPALKALAHNYPNLMALCWEQVSSIVHGVLSSFSDVPARSWRGNVEHTVAPSKERVMTAAIKVYFFPFLH
ncbi:hypothetical protein BUALT_Bualt05G0000400 [Buddleja alternifolia]|uniref:Retrotransposon gag domain-containing protein n=1 Tax=Buddleja alternifolia TaxID=168488 RepID=A0AAV6XFC5_9LAMI|nr:hypothetical protein BUALT_Bualt05G0000400 [Buddleja alternifolia]